MGTDFDASWALIVGSLYATMSASQRRIAEESFDYVPAVLEDVGATAKVPSRERPRADPFVGVTGTGVSVDEAMFAAVITAKVGVRDGATVPQALKLGENRLMQTAQLALADTGRLAERVAFAPRPVAFYTRILTLPSCSRCAVLAGRRYRMETAFQRHPNCFPAGVAVDGPALDAATRRWYEGELVILTTASGQELPVTGNHPILTSRGWVPANLLNEGDEVVRSTRSQGATSLVVPDHDQVPSRIEDVWSSFSVAGLDTVESSPEDFHGDGQYGEVDIVRSYRALDRGGESAFFQHGPEKLFSAAGLSPQPLVGQGAAEVLDLWNPSHPGGFVGGGDLLLPFAGAESGVPGFTCVAHAPQLDSGFHETGGQGSSGYAVFDGQSMEAGSGAVFGGDFSSGDVGPHFPRWDAPGAEFSVETRSGYAERGRDLLDRLAGQVEMDRLVDVRVSSFSGHVYSLASSEGWHSANSLIVSNCDCVHGPAEDWDNEQEFADSYFESLPTAEELDEKYPHLTVKMRREAGIYSQEDIFTKAGAEAIRKGADINQIVNARRGMYTAADGARYTREGVTRRGWGNRQMRQHFGNRSTRRRLMPEELQAIAGRNKDEFLRLLRAYGYF